jgi:hypothetical protein
MDALSEVRLVTGIGPEGDRYATRLGIYSKKHHIDVRRRELSVVRREVILAIVRSAQRRADASSKRQQPIDAFDQH